MGEHRLFVALPLPDQTKKLITEFQANLQMDIKWIPMDNLHITLAFIGPTPTERISAINSVLEKIGNSSPLFNLKTKSTKVVKGSSGMIWITFEENHSYSNLAISIREHLNLTEKRKPLPHINLARLKKPNNQVNLPEDPRFKGHTIPCPKIELWESEIKHTGTEYRVISSFSLN